MLFKLKLYAPQALILPEKKNLEFAIVPNSVIKPFIEVQSDFT